MRGGPALRPAHPHRSSSASQAHFEEAPWVITTIPSWPTQPGCPHRSRFGRPLDPGRPGRRPWSSISIVFIRPCRGPLASGNRQDLPSIPPRSDHPGKPGRASREGRPPPGRTGVGPEVFRKLSGLETVFLTNDFDDPLEGWDTTAYVPCLRTDDLVLKLHDPRTTSGCGRHSTWTSMISRACARRSAGCSSGSWRRGARAVAVSLPPDFAPRAASHRRAATPIRKAIHGMELRGDEIEEVRSSVFWIVAEYCASFGCRST